MPTKPVVFARITKVDEEKRLVYGRAAQEVVDHSGEIFDYASSKPLFEAWSAEVHKDSGGKSFGNIRAMHSNIAAGKVSELSFDDAEQAIDIVAKVVDDGEWDKVVEGVYTGFSIGGSYAKRWDDVVGNKQVKRYTAKPIEISLVDRPCMPTAKFFDIIKGDGTVAKIAFKEPAATKGTHDIVTFAELIRNLKWLADSAEWEKQAEGDDSQLPVKIRAAVALLLGLLSEMALEESSELTSADVGKTLPVEELRKLTETVDALRMTIDDMVAKNVVAAAATATPSTEDPTMTNKAETTAAAPAAAPAAPTGDEPSGAAGAQVADGSQAAGGEGSAPAAKSYTEDDLKKMVADAIAAATPEIIAAAAPAIIEEAMTSMGFQKAAPAPTHKAAPSLFAVDKDGKLEKASGTGGEIIEVEPVRLHKKDEAEAATLIKAIHARGPSQIVAGR